MQNSSMFQAVSNILDNRLDKNKSVKVGTPVNELLRDFANGEINQEDIRVKTFLKILNVKRLWRIIQIRS